MLDALHTYWPLLLMAILVIAQVWYSVRVICRPSPSEEATAKHDAVSATADGIDADVKRMERERDIRGALARTYPSGALADRLARLEPPLDKRRSVVDDLPLIPERAPAPALRDVLVEDGRVVPLNNTRGGVTP